MGIPGTWGGNKGGIEKFIGGLITYNENFQNDPTRRLEIRLRETL